MRKMLKFIIPLVCLLALSSCSTVPKTVYRPWNRILSDQEIQIGAVISIFVETKSTPLLGSEKLVEERIKEKATALLQRRGFLIRDNNPEYNLKITYQVIPGVEEITFTKNYSSGSYEAYSKSNNLGVILAQSISTAFTQNAVLSQTTSVKRDIYTHLVSCELINQNGQLVWKYDSKTNAESIDILNVYTPLLQIAISSLPSSVEIIPMVAKLKQERFNDFVNLFIINRFYMCPALPNYIQIEDSKGYDNQSSDNHQNSSWVKRSDQPALMAFIDLLETAEYAIPNSSEKKWKKPTDNMLWKNVTLMGRYRLGNNDTPVNAVIMLKGTPNCYVVSSARLVSDQEYAKLQEKHDHWVGRLKEYFNFYED